MALPSQTVLSDPFDPLNTRFSGVSAELRSTAFGAGVYVAVGDSGNIFSSTDTVIWVPRSSGTTNRLNSVRFGNSGFVAVGEGQSGTASTILNSTDGVRWVSCAAPITNTLRGVCYLSGRYVAVGSAGIVVTSTNGLNWEAVQTGAPYNLNAVEAATVSPVSQYENDFVAVGDAGAILTSHDGLVWTARFSGIFARLWAIAISPVSVPTFVAVGDSGTVATSGDGVIWTAQSSGTATNLYSVASDNGGRFGAVGAGGVFVVQTNELGWSFQSSGTTNDLRAVVYENGNFLAVGEGGAIQAGIAWLPHDSGTPQGLSGVAFGKGMFAAVGAQGTIVTSSNGVNWVRQESGSASNLKEVCYGNNQFVAVGEGTVLTSTNGLEWKVEYANETNVLVAVAYGNGTYVAIGWWNYPGFAYTVGVALQSKDGVTWNGPYSLPTEFDGSAEYGLAFGTSNFVAVGSLGGAIATSSDGTIWTSRNSGVGKNGLYGVAFGNNRFVAVGQYILGYGSQITTSADGIIWTPTNSGYNNFGAITYGDLGFVAPSVEFVQGNGYFTDAISTSQDGITWVSRPINNGTTSVAFGNGTYVLLCDAGTIRQSTPAQARPQPLLVGRLIGSGFELSMTAQPSFNYTLQRSAGFAGSAWTNVYSFSSTQVVTKFLDSTVNHLGNFYRITSP